MTRLLLNQKGNFSLIRMGSLIAFAGVLVLLVALLSFFADQRTRRSPLNIPPPEGAVDYGIETKSNREQHQYYRMPVDTLSVDDVVAHYNRRLAEFSSSGASATDETCVRQPGVGDFLGYQRGNNTVPFQYKCMFDNSSFGTFQFTEVTIQPGIFSADPALNTEGQVIIQYEQQWSP